MPTASVNDDWRTLYPFASHSVEVPSGRMHYIDEQPSRASENNPPETCLFVHGNPTWSFHSRELITALRSRYRCVAVDHVGCGLSEKPNGLFTLDDRIDDLCASSNRCNSIASRSSPKIGAGQSVWDRCTDFVNG